MTRPGFGRPASGPGHYLRDLVYGANDGVITTLAVVAGVTGAGLNPRIALVLGLANLVADGISMGASNYLGLKSELDQRGLPASLEKPARHGLATFSAFVLVGAIPLAAYLAPRPFGAPTFVIAALLAAVALGVVGAARAPLTRRPIWMSAGEMVLVGGLAAAAAFAIGAGSERVVGAVG